MLPFPEFDEPFIVETNATKVAVGAVLSQKKTDGKVHPVQFWSRSMNAAEHNYCTCERKALSAVFDLKKLQVHLLSCNLFTLVTDHQALQYAFKSKDI